MSANDVVPIFKLADLLQLYTDRLIELGVDITGRIHSTYLKNQILANLPGLNSYKDRHTDRQSYFIRPVK